MDDDAGALLLRQFPGLCQNGFFGRIAASVFADIWFSAHLYKFGKMGRCRKGLHTFREHAGIFFYNYVKIVRVWWSKSFPSVEKICLHNDVFNRVGKENLIFFAELWKKFEEVVTLKKIMTFLPYNAKQWFRNNEYIFYIIFVAIWITGIASMIISPAINGITNGIMSLVRMIFGM